MAVRTALGGEFGVSKVEGVCAVKINGWAVRGAAV